MNKLFAHLSRYVMIYLLLPSIIVVGLMSYNRFILKNDYLVEYEKNCNPDTASCFVKCEDNDCREKNYYLKMIKYAPDLYAECGNDIAECSQANRCLKNDNYCSLMYCQATARESCDTINQ